MAGRETAARRKRTQELQKAALAALLQKIDVFSNQSKDSVSVLGGTTNVMYWDCLLYTSPSPRDQRGSRMPSSA